MTTTAIDNIEAIDAEESLLRGRVADLEYRARSAPSAEAPNNLPERVQQFWRERVQQEKDEARRSGGSDTYRQPQWTNAEALTAVVSYVSRLNSLRGDLERNAYSQRQEQGSELARAFTKDKTTQALYVEVAIDWSARLDAIARLANHIDRAIEDGANPGALPAIPHTELTSLDAFCTWWRTANREGVAIDINKLPDSVRPRLEAGR